jgi:hypothetical protein
LFGAFLILEEQATELTIKGIGTIKDAAEQANVNAKAIADLKNRAEAHTATIDRIATEAAEAKQLLNDLNINHQVATNNLSRLDRSIANSSLAVRNLQLLTELSSTILLAKNDSRQAYEQLLIWSEDSSFRFQKEASQAATSLMNHHNPRLVRSGFGMTWNEDVDPQVLSIDELWVAFSDIDPYQRIAILEFVWEERTDIPLIDRLQFLVDVLRRDESLLVTEYAGRYFNEGTNDGFRPIDIDAHLKWWEENQDLIE